MPPDPITTLTDEERGYLAGLIDGEGSIYVAAVGPHRSKTVYPIVCVAMTCRPVVEWVANRLQSGKVQLHNHSSIRRHQYLKAQYRTQLFGKRAQILCSTLLSLLRVKHEQARLVLEFPVDARVGPGQKLSEEIKAQRLALRDKINGLNREGRASPAITRSRKTFLRER